MENEIEKKETAEDEISLLDLFAVLIRHRKLIVIGTAVITVLAGLWLFIVPLFVPKLAVRNTEVTYTVKVQSIPSAILGKIPSNGSPLSLANYSTQRLPFLVEQLKKNNVFSDSKEKSEISDYDFNIYVQALLKDDKIKVSNSPLGNEYTIVLKVPESCVQDTEAFINDVVAEIDDQLVDYFIPLIKTLQQNTEITLEKATALQIGLPDISSTQSLQELSTDIGAFLEDFDGFLSLYGEPFVVPVAKGRVKKMIIVIFASFFVFVFIAFLKNAINNIKADPSATKLISDAWKEGK